MKFAKITNNIPTALRLLTNKADVTYVMEFL